MDTQQYWKMILHNAILRKGHFEIFISNINYSSLNYKPTWYFSATDFCFDDMEQRRQSSVLLVPEYCYLQQQKMQDIGQSFAILNAGSLVMDAPQVLFNKFLLYFYYLGHPSACFIDSYIIQNCVPKYLENFLVIFLLLTSILISLWSKKMLHTT